MEKYGDTMTGHCSICKAAINKKVRRPCGKGYLSQGKPCGGSQRVPPGDGGNAEEGRYRLEPATPRGMIIPPANRSLKGIKVEVWVFVDEQGKVVADSTRLNPPTKDKGFNQSAHPRGGGVTVPAAMPPIPARGLRAEALLDRWRTVPRVEPQRMGADLDAILDATV